ncbi:hypothetical protein A3C09_04780 [Candidatus Uhrbacteria bacterium RIFCSPHIGHO2_02_FULL_47_44]|uniref:Uncharacterized protein n=1 Tax=Candidatus Uhrbacteria bacterium RIFCSPLOWO2_02_FULL_48_18 TaxID=1802408 RepID=A0A1F7VDP0_9BACT|nr:MAG: hypothetical protein A2839_00945 [Candidatus Uhrbacteria bacterium RIFCSPHIGHO2_01_FULL_47_10]OGL71944.1 MAG: hypothetical protein A3C09_04780 [Candidatus Uhrbacteria bacterium RIFCSPHIGHO2_02_FULL_47_44]OGL76814.1 MAG: hypothetical protein A3E97_04540 [Candidatus Uhrbacteria bacterium RIFCSPHIGHO2_12_FULL_47_12]OGL80569.1 MAG: hypothetical protein A3B20_04175 [Candidatus Uhrbacteria bacterium RIFCSPLOWO2_01_FULL_47_17]OGL88248.1 MAG: hypothetical protein A3I41_00805 [Candidatus Uhrbact
MTDSLNVPDVPVYDIDLALCFPDDDDDGNDGEYDRWLFDSRNDAAVDYNDDPIEEPYEGEEGCVDCGRFLQYCICLDDERDHDEWEMDNELSVLDALEAGVSATNRMRRKQLHGSQRPGYNKRHEYCNHAWKSSHRHVRKQWARHEVSAVILFDHRDMPRDGLEDLVWLERMPDWDRWEEVLKAAEKEEWKWDAWEEPAGWERDWDYDSRDYDEMHSYHESLGQPSFDYSDPNPEATQQLRLEDQMYTDSDY